MIVSYLHYIYYNFNFFLLDLKCAYEWVFTTYAPQDMHLHGKYRAMELTWQKEFKLWRRERARKEEEKTKEAMIEKG